MECFTCRVANGEDTEAIVVWRDELIVVNHTDGADRAGWFVVSPVRHVTRFHEMTDLERNDVVGAAAVLDAVLTRCFSSTRTMVASLGWLVDDHVHFHVVPTFQDNVSNGYLNFGGAYVPVALEGREVARLVEAEIEAIRELPAQT